ncbi:zona pellucida sperm-binding protein 3d.2 isoform X2 [Silurus meridionalis]|uniref:zona pellucida sperm-binding protein 3d.2 isoform X2 n=1 Tax=Silurus meridionalis TaxID=175797 RepID=UPI001EEC31B8|nr:zona pellucida sperm-binding protein 3d.2 isoform X2 [Silurus meridionalis]
MGLVFVFMALFGTFARAAGSDPLPFPVPTPDPVTGGEYEELEAPYLHLPVFLHYRAPRVDKRHFSPAHAKSRETLPERVRRLLLPEPRRRPKMRARPNGPVSVACSAREMRVRVHTASLGAGGGGRVHVRLGSCDVSRRSEQSVFFQFELHECGTLRRIINNTVVYSNMLYYTSAVGVSGSEMFSVPVQCHFNRFYYSYKIGFVPAVERLKYFKPMKTKGTVTLTACDAQWNRLSPTEGFIIGQLMYFEAETLYVPDSERLFVHFCHVTTNSSRDSLPRINIINNHGCLMDSRRSSQSRFINSSKRNVVRFTIDAFVLQGKVQKYLFIHCEMSIRSSVPTETSKLCSYDQQEQRWEELHGVDSVCLCCDSYCIPKMTTLIQPLTNEFGTLVEQHPEGKSKNPTQSITEIFTSKPEHKLFPSERDYGTTSPERTLPSEHGHGTVTPPREHLLESENELLMPDSERGVLTQESDHGKITLEDTPTPEVEQGLLTPESTHTTLTPNSEHKILIPDDEHGEITWGGTPTLESEHEPPAPDGEHEMPPAPDGEHEMPPAPDGEHEMPPPPDGEHGLLTLYKEHKDLLLKSEQRPLIVDGEHVILTPEDKHGKTTPETPPTLVGVYETLLPEAERGSLTPDSEHRKAETFAPPAEQNLIAPVYKHAELQEPYRIFEEVFGLS